MQRSLVTANPAPSVKEPCECDKGILRQGDQIVHLSCHLGSSSCDSVVFAARLGDFCDIFAY